MPDSRLLELLTLLQSRNQWSAAELVDRLGVTSRTLRRDLDRLRDLGYPVRSVPGRGGGYRLGRGGRMPPLVLDDEETVAVAIGLRTAAGETVEGIGDASLRALVKLDQLLPARLRTRVSALREATAPLPAATAPVDAAALVTIARGCDGTEVLRFGYRDRYGRVSERRAEPHRLVPTGRRWYLVARDLADGGWRTFRVDRVSEPVLTGQRFTPHDPPDAADFVSRAVGSAPYTFQARVLVQAPAATVRAKVPPTAGTVYERTDDRAELVTGADSLDAIAVHLAMLDEEFRVLEPMELVDAVRRLAERLQRGSAGTPA